MAPAELDDVTHGDVSGYLPVNSMLIPRIQHKLYNWHCIGQSLQQNAPPALNITSMDLALKNSNQVVFVNGIQKDSNRDMNCYPKSNTEIRLFISTDSSDIDTDRSSVSKPSPIDDMPVVDIESKTEEGPVLNHNELNELNRPNSDSVDHGGGGAGDSNHNSPPVEEANMGAGDVMQSADPGIAEDVVPSPGVSEEQIKQMNDRLHEQERRAQRLLRRLRRIQIRQTHDHVSSQLGSYVNYHHQNLETMAQQGFSTVPQQPQPGTSTPQSPVPTAFTPALPSTSTEPPSPSFTLQNDKIKNLSTASLVNLVRKLQAARSPMSLRQRSLSQTQDYQPSLLRMTRNERVESERTADKLTYIGNHLKKAVDPDATESSSGGESSDECLWGLEPVRLRTDSPVNVTKTAPWAWSRDRAEVAYRWTWLQAQVSDLEYRIRTQTDISRQLKAAKIAPVHAAPNVESTPKSAQNSVTSSPANLNKILTNIDRQTCMVSQSLGVLTPAASPSTSKTALSGSTKIASGHIDQMGFTDLTEPDATCQAARCNALESYRKRKLYRTFSGPGAGILGLVSTSRKANRLSTLRCRCYPPATPCAMCGGKLNHTLRVAESQQSLIMPRDEKLAILDPSHHPVLSFPEDVNTSLIMEPLVRFNPGLHKPTSMAKSMYSLAMEKAPSRYKRKYARASQKKLKKSAASLVSMKYKTRMTEKQQRELAKGKRRADKRTLSRAELRKRKKLKLAIKRERSQRQQQQSGSRLSSYNNSPRDSPAPQDASVVGQRAGENSKYWMKTSSDMSAYDIDNIVIPFGLHASTRVEKMEYKEIITPKWRLNPLDEQTIDEDFDSEFLEDISEEMHISRHVTCEIREKQRFLNFVTPGRKTRGSMRGTESGATTPEPVAGTSFGAESGQAEVHEPGTPIPSPQGLSERRRSDSGSFLLTRSRRQSFSEVERSRTNTPDPVATEQEYEPRLFQAWEARTFPISAQLYDSMVAESERIKLESQMALPESSASTKDVNEDDEIPGSNMTSAVTTPNGSPPATPMEVSSDEEEILEESVDDPEWNEQIN